MTDLDIIENELENLRHKVFKDLRDKTFLNSRKDTLQREIQYTKCKVQSLAECLNYSRAKLDDFKIQLQEETSLCENIASEIMSKHETAIERNKVVNSFEGYLLSNEDFGIRCIKPIVAKSIEDCNHELRPIYKRRCQIIDEFNSVKKLKSEVDSLEEEFTSLIAPSTGA